MAGKIKDRPEKKVKQKGEPITKQKTEQKPEQKLTKASRLILDVLSDLEKSTSDSATNTAVLEGFESLMQSVDKLRAEIDPGEKISDFFEEVGQGVVNAQQRLDQHSIKYNNNRLSVAPPTSFRIPKVDAEIKFAMTRSTTKGFNILVFNSKSTEGQSQQNSVKFEIAAVPPPPDHMRSIPLQAGFVTSYEARAYIQSITLEIIKLRKPELPKKTQNYIREQFAQVLVVVNEAGKWLLLFRLNIVKPPNDKAITGVIVDPENQKIVIYGKFNADGSIPEQSDSRYKLLDSFFSDILASQIDHLKPEPNELA